MIILAVVVIIAIIISFFTRKAIVRRKLKKAPLRSLADFKHGETAKIVGRVEFVDEPLEAPLSGRECAWYCVRIMQSHGKSSSTLIEAEDKCRFVLRDGDKVAYINDNTIKKYIEMDKRYHSGTFEDAGPRLEAYLKKHDKKSQGFLGLNKSLHYSEGVLEKGEAVAVLGKGEWRDAESLGLPREYGVVLSITTSENNPVYLSDDPDTVTVHGKSS
ncbi:hypothetical protein HYN59_13900 [Flavobacterium album]|uniref:RING-type E3 ubiquitin transferase n=1 Tax=Flavobacterium album TaxID=2175091 RepID=A0A2S1R331_9FLAO|nr:hypothetical protein HYN59_13900 [Flavobacterium album]